MSCLGGEPLKAAGLCTKSQEPALNALGTLWVEARPGLREGQRVLAGLLHVPGGSGPWAWPLVPRP